MSQKPPKSKVIIHGFVLSRGLRSGRHEVPSRDMRCHWKGVKWLGTNIWIHLCYFEAILGFTRNEHMRCSKAFRGNANTAKYPDNVTSHVGSPKNVSRKYDHARRSPKISQKQSILKVIIHASSFPRTRASNARGCLLRTWEVIGKESCGLERICGYLYVHFETILGFTINE